MSEYIFSLKKNALECFNMEVFTDCENSITIPFEEYIDNVEFYFIDFIKFYINYVNATVSCSSWKL